MARKSAKRSSAIRRILAIDIGGTALKAALIDANGKFLTAQVREKTPHRAAPPHLVPRLVQLVAPFRKFDRVTIGFPGYVRDGVVFTAPHLGTNAWAGFDLETAMRVRLKKPVRVHNDADIQGLGVIKGKGLELVCTLGTGFGTALFQDGVLLPHMDLAHMAIHPHDDFDKYLGDRTLKKIGHKDWNRRLKKTVAMLRKVFFYDHLYLGGGNSRHVRLDLPRNVSVVSNDAGIGGGAFIWCPKGRK